MKSFYEWLTENRLDPDYISWVVKKLSSNNPQEKGLALQRVEDMDGEGKKRIMTILRGTPELYNLVNSYIRNRYFKDGFTKLLRGLTSTEPTERAESLKRVMTLSDDDRQVLLDKIRGSRVYDTVMNYLLNRGKRTLQ